MKSWINLIFVAIAAVGGYLLAVSNVEETKAPGLAETFANAKYVELTHVLSEEIPSGPARTPPTIGSIKTHADGSTGIHHYNFPGQWGTHVDPPIHFVENLRTLEDIPLSEMILPLIVIDVHEKVEANPDYQVSMEDVEAWEKSHGQIPANSFVALRTDWHKRWPDVEKMRNRDADGISHSPGWSREVIDYLVLTRNITAIGHETLDTDPGIRSGSGNWPLQNYYMSLDKYQIENMRSLDLVPPIGAFIVSTWAIPKDGSGFPARVFAIVPEGI